MTLQGFISDFMVYIYPFYLGLIVLEFIFARHLYNLKESLSSLAIALVSSVIAATTKVWALALFFLIFEITKEFRLEILGYESFGWAWYVWVLAIILDDFNFYWHHRFSHELRILWAAHVPHHNAETFNLTVSIRNGWFITLYKPLFWLWMPLIGFEPVMIAIALIINAAYQFFLHSQLVPSLGWFEKIFNTPYIHRVHHSCNVEYLDKNHGGMLIIWDKIFGTFQNVIPDLKPKYGVLKGPDSLNPITANTHEFSSIWSDVRKAKSWKDRFKFIFYPPGWSPDKTTKTAKQMQEELKLNLEVKRKPKLKDLEPEAVS